MNTPISFKLMIGSHRRKEGGTWIVYRAGEKDIIVSDNPMEQNLFRTTFSDKFQELGASLVRGPEAPALASSNAGDVVAEANTETLAVTDAAGESSQEPVNEENVEEGADSGAEAAGAEGSEQQDARAVIAHHHGGGMFGLYYEGDDFTEEKRLNETWITKTEADAELEKRNAAPAKSARPE